VQAMKMTAKQTVQTVQTVQPAASPVRLIGGLSGAPEA
jgi:hypothetical protein